MRSASKKRRARQADYQRAKLAVAKRSRGWCEFAINGVCTGHAQDVHHLRGRVGEDLCDIEHMRAVCRACHDYAESHRTEGYANGWLERRTDTA